MQPIATASEMREIDRISINDYGIPGIVLMEHAAECVTASIEHQWGNVSGKQILICCGHGNNGGDGFAIARLCAHKNARVAVVLLGHPDRMSADTAVNYQACQKLGIKVTPYSTNTFPTDAAQADIIVDALLGTGTKGELQADMLSIVQQINKHAHHTKVVSVDIPTGIHSDTAQILADAVHADLTVTFGLRKPGVSITPGYTYCGELVVADIGLPWQAVKQVNPQLCWSDIATMKQLLPVRPIDGHKGTFGHTLIVGGSAGFAGAPMLAVTAAMKAGTGLCSAAIPSSYVSAGLSVEPGAMWYGMNGDPEHLDAEAAAQITHLVAQAKAVAIGPGLGQHADTIALLKCLLSQTLPPVVLDADALNIIASNPDIDKLPSQAVMTPHPGELSRLLRTSISDVQNNRLSAAQTAAAKFGCTVLLKGARSIVASPEQRTTIISTGNPVLAVGGSGDILSGIIASLMAQGLSPYHAAICGATWHGLAGDITAENFGQTGSSPTNIVQAIPQARMRCLSVEASS